MRAAQRALVVAALLAVPVGAGCGGPPDAPPLERGAAVAPPTSSDTAPGSPDGSSSTTVAPGTATTRGPAADGEPTQGGVLRMGIEAPPSFDPADIPAASQSGLVVADLLFDGLTAIGTDGGPVPALAAGWEASEDLSTWRFTLRDGARFGDGSAVTADDVVFSLTRMAALGSGSPAGGALAGMDVTAPSPGVVAVDAGHPLAEVPAILSSPLFGVVPRASASSPTFDAAPVGSGPFRVAARDGSVVHLVPADGVDAHLDGIDLHVFDDDAAAYQAWVAGDVDWSQVPTTAVDAARARAGDRGFVPFQAMLYLGLNLRSPSFEDGRFRQAILAAVDRDAAVRAVYGSAVDPRAGIVPVGVPGGAGDACGTPCRHDVARARALLAQAFPDGRVPEVPIDYDEGRSQEALARAVQDDLAAAGIPSTLRGRPAGEYAVFATSGAQGLFRLGWVGVAASPELWLGPLFRSGGDENAVGLADDEVDAAIDAARAEPEPARRAAAYAAAERLILSRAVVVPLAQFRTATVFTPRVRALTPRVDGTFDATGVWLER